MLRSSKLYEAIPDETIESNTTSNDSVWQIFFDRAARMGQRGKIIAGVAVFISLEDDILPYIYSLTKPCSNNVAKYNVLNIGLEIAVEIEVKYLEVYDNSKLIINQVNGE